MCPQARLLLAGQEPPLQEGQPSRLVADLRCQQVSEGNCGTIFKIFKIGNFRTLQLLVVKKDYDENLVSKFKMINAAIGFSFSFQIILLE